MILPAQHPSQNLIGPLFPTQFIISGSLSVAAERNHTSCLVSLKGDRTRDGDGVHSPGCYPGTPSRRLTHLAHSASTSWGFPKCPWRELRHPHKEGKDGTLAKCHPKWTVRVSKESVQGHSEKAGSGKVPKRIATKLSPGVGLGLGLERGKLGD